MEVRPTVSPSLASPVCRAVSPGATSCGRMMHMAGNPNNPLRKQTAKATKAVVEQRVTVVAEKLARAWSNTKIAQYAAEEWGMKKRQVDEYIQRANAEIMRQYSQRERPEFVASRLAILETLADKGIESGQLAAAVGALALQAKITRLCESNGGGKP